MSDPDETDLLAAEYVLGTLDADARARVEAARAADPALEAAIATWDLRFAPLLEAVPEVAPPAEVYPALTRRLFSTPDSRPASATPVGDFATASQLRRQLRAWRAATAACAALAAALAVWIAVDSLRQAQPQFVAILQKDAGSPAILVDVDLRARDMLVKPVDATPPQGKSLELWIIEPSLGAPRSLGLVDPGHVRSESLGRFDPSILTKALFAVTIEPKGGAPHGAPTSAPVWTGHLTQLVH